MKLFVFIIVCVAIVTIGAFVYFKASQPFGVSVTPIPAPVIDSTPRNVTLSGKFMCLPHADTSGPLTTECAFGFQSDDGKIYAVNFGQSAEAMRLFQERAQITAEGFVVPREALSNDQWSKYDMVGVFTITRIVK